MFPDSITIYKHNVINGEDVYFMQCLNGFYWQETSEQNGKDKGVESKNNVTVISSAKLAESYGKEWKTDIGDIIIKGKGNHITSVKELDDYYKVYSVSVNV